MTTRTLAATADTYVNQQRPDRSYGDALLLRADAPPQTFRSYLRFDIPPDLGRVESMTLKIHVRSKSARGLAVHAVDSGWDETSITWVTAPKPGARLGSLSPTDRSGWYAARLALPGQPGAHLNLAIVSTSKTMAAFDSREFGSAAQLLLTESKSG